MDHRTVRVALERHRDAMLPTRAISRSSVKSVTRTLCVTRPTPPEMSVVDKHE